MMSKMTLIFTLFLFVILLSPSFGFGAVQDFCIADYTSQETPSGFPCKDKSNVTGRDFVFSGLGPRTNTSNIFKSGLAAAIYTTFPALNGQDIALARVDLEAGGVVPLHTHPRATEIVFIVEGTIIAGIITTENKVLLTTLNKGDVMVFPQGLLHFQYNSPSSRPATVIVAFNSENPGLQYVPNSLFGNNLPTFLVGVNTFISDPEIRRIKRLFGGSG